MFLIRRIEPRDAATLKHVRLAALRDAPSAFGSNYEAEYVMRDDDWVDRALAGSVGTDRVTFFAEVDRQVVALVGGFRADPQSQRIDLVSMWVSPNARMRGIGRCLVTAVVDWAADAKATEIALWVTRGNSAAEELYRSIGFVSTGEIKPLPSDPSKYETELVLSIT